MADRNSEEWLCRNCKAKIKESLTASPEESQLMLWKSWFEIDANRSVLEEAEQLKETEESFHKDVAKVGGRRLLNSKSVFETREAMLALASSDIMRWQVAHKTWATDRSRGAKKIGAKLQNSIHRFRQYLDSYSGVVEIVKQADPIFGPIACSTLSVFLVVIDSKTKEEEILSEALDALIRDTDHIARLARCVPSNRAAHLVIQYYIATIKLARDAIKYFTRSYLSRFWIAVSKPPDTFLRDKVLELKRALKCMEKEAEIVAMENLSNLLTLYKKERDYRNRKRISPVQKRLCLSKSRLDCAKEFSELYLIPRMWCKKYEDFDFETVLAGDPVFQGWIKGQESQILLLHGESHMRHAYHWLSAAALGMVSSLVEKAEAPESKPLSAFLHPDPWLPNGARVPQGALISSLISQILEHCPTIAEDFAFFQYLEARIQSSEWFDDTTCENQYDVLGQLLEHRKECYVILDRLDCCDCPLAIVLQNFLKFIGECQNVIVKIFIVVKDEPEMRDIVSPLKSKLRVIRKDQGKRRRQS